MLKSSERAKLRGLANSKDTVKINIGKEYLNANSIANLEAAIDHHELIKVSLLKSVNGDIKDVSAILCSKLNAESVQMIGRTIVLYRKNPKLGDKSKYKL